MRNKIAIRSLPVALISCILVASGCGGGSKSGEGTGRVRIVVEWPAPSKSVPKSRYIPAYAQSLVFELYKESNPTKRVTIVSNRPDDLPATQIVEFNQVISTGTYVLAGVARVEKGGQGSTVASALTNVTVQPFRVADVEITLASTLRTITILGTPLSVPKGGRLNLSGEARDPDGKLVFLPTSALKWSINSGGAFGTLTADGIFDAVNVGTVNVKLSEDGAGVSGSADVTVTPASALATTAAPKDRGDLLNTGRSPGSGATANKQWQKDLGGILQTAIKSTAVIGLDGAIYICPVDIDFTKLHPSGATIWTAPIRQAFRGTAAIGSNGFIYVPSTTGLYALDVADGSTKWVYNSGIRIDSSPTIGSDGTVYVALGNRLTAINGTTGAKLWDFQLLGGGSGCPALDSAGTLYVCTDAGRVYAVNSADGTQKWRFTAPTTDTMFGSVAVNGTTAYVTSSDHKLYALDTANGAKRWEFDSGQSIQTSPAIGTDGTVYFCTSSVSNDKVFAINGNTGAKVWEYQRHPSITVVFLSAPVIGADGVLYITSTWEGGKLHAINTSNGTLNWEFGLTAFGEAAPTVGGDGTVYVGDEKGQFFAVK